MKKIKYGPVIKKIVLTVILVVFAGSFLMPGILTVTNSFMAEAELSWNYGNVFGFDSNLVHSSDNSTMLKLLPDMVDFSQYRKILLEGVDYLMKFWNSVILVVPIVLGQVGLALMCAYGFTRMKGKVKTILVFGYMVLMLMPFQVLLVPNYLVSKWLNILDTRWAIWLPGIFAPYSVYLLTKFMKRIPEELIESARLDGAGEWKVFTKICIPLCRSAVMSVMILVFIDYWNMVEQPIILLKDTDLHPLSVFLAEINSGEIGVAFAAAVVYMIPTILIFLFGEDYLVEGINYSGGAKG